MPRAGYKRCTKCGETKALDLFSRNPDGRDGRQSQCKACRAVRRREWHVANRERAMQKVQEWRRANPERVKELEREYRERNPDQVRRTLRESRKRRAQSIAEAAERRHREAPEKRNARQRLNYAVRVGKVVKPDACEDCHRPAPPHELHGHHEDYSRALDVAWLCPACHSARHS